MGRSLPISKADNITPYSNFGLPSQEEGKTVCNPDAPHFDLSAIPVPMRVDDVDSNFVHVSIDLIFWHFPWFIRDLGRNFLLIFFPESDCNKFWDFNILDEAHCGDRGHGPKCETKAPVVF